MAQPAAQAEKSPVPSNATAQISYSGTPRGSDGTTTPDDYSRKLQSPVTRMEIFEEMGNDDAVHTGIDARRQEICAANWQLASEDENTEILEFIEDNIYPILDDLLRWLGGGALQYGFGAMEPVFQWSDRPVVSSLSRGKVKRATRKGDERIYIRKLAHIRQTGIETFKIAGPADNGALAGDLLTVRQHVYDGVTFRAREIPAEKLLMWTYNRQGDDYWGVPPARHCYKGWDFKQQLERLNLLHNDKFSVGTPVVIEPEGGYGELDRQRTANFLRAWRSTSDNFLIVPNGSTVEIMSDDGKTSMSMLEWVRYYNLTIAKTYLTHQTELGSTDTGARALGETFAEQLTGIVQADVEALAALINNGLIVPLVNWNFGEQDVYPIFTPSHRVKMSGGIATVLQTLINCGAVHVRPEDERWARDAFELPPVELKDLQAEQGVRDASAKAIADAAAKADPSPGDEKGGKVADDKSGDSKPPLKIAADRQRTGVKQLGQLAEGAPTPAVWGQTTYRTPEYSNWEHGILRPDVLGQELDIAVTRASAEVKDVLRLIDEDLTAQVTKFAAQGTAALRSAVRSIVVPEKFRTQLRKVLIQAAQRARDFGGQAVKNEIERQLGPSAIGPQRAPYVEMFGNQMRYAAGGDDESIDDIKLSAEVDRTVEDEIDRREQSARSAALTAIEEAAGAAADVLATIATSAAKEGLIGLSPYRTADNVEGVINKGFGIGRTETAAAIAEPPAGGGGGNRSGLRDAQGQPIDLVAKVYSAVMDFGTCDECVKWDGAEFEMSYPEDFTGVQAPNPRCAGSARRCRCVWVYITNKESVPLVPASKGPEPIRRAS